jgi:outer membrane protein assembly factor BamB
VVSGFIFGAQTVQDLAVLKLDPESGAEVWRRTIDGQAHWTDHGWAVTVDSNDDVVAAGQIFRRNTTWGDFAVVKLAGTTGRRLWQWTRGGQATATAWGVAVDPNDHVVAVGEIQGVGTKADFTVVLLNRVTGRPIRQVMLDGTDHWFDVAFDVAVSETGAVVAAGWFVNQGTGADLAVVRLR